MKRFLVALAVLFPLTVVAAEGVLLLYRQQEPGVEPYNTRILITADHLRMDDGVDGGDYLIFERKSGLISSVTHEDETVLEIPVRKVMHSPPVKLDRRTMEVELDNPPLVGDMKPRQHRLYINDDICYNVVAVEGLLEDARRALMAFRFTLAGEHDKLLPRLPADQQDPCDMARNIFYSDWQLEFGLPIQEWDEQGHGQTLMDYREKTALEDKLFTLPQGYRHFTTDRIQ